ncbi:MAG: hypothetical protein M3Y87_05955 [Myxococcota bacterium]|nr:hypothetical protein [Myxococcota bacterium]
MRKRAISVTLSPDSIAWLRARSAAIGARSISETLDRVVQAARESESAMAPARSAVGMVRLPDDVPDLAGADADVRAWLGAHLEPV